MAGTWMSIVEGFGGMREKNTLNFSPKFQNNGKAIPLKSILETNYNRFHYAFRNYFFSGLKT
jgi:trehalose/maltose hydrolase-like predicted phosphorylase